MKQATTVVSFTDLKEGALREVGDAFLCDEERGEYLAALGLVQLKDAPEEEPEKDAPEEEPEEPAQKKAKK